jgi:hypothetical protein
MMARDSGRAAGLEATGVTLIGTAMLKQSWAGEVFADYHQFYLWDSGRTNQAPVEYSEEDVSRRIKTGEHVVVIQPERNFAVPVSIEVHDAEPRVVQADWDHIAEASLHVPTGALQVHECTGGVVADFKVPPGWYRVRSLHAKLGSVDGIDGQDHYRVLVWPAPEGPVVVIKQFGGGTSAT